MTIQEDTRALIFVCHSMGGIVVKQVGFRRFEVARHSRLISLCKALIIAKNESELYPNIRESVSAILFLGTPHQGSPTADYASILSQIANVFVIGIQASRFAGPIRTDLLKSLRASEKELLRIAEDFRVHTATIKITSFIEQKTMQGLNERVCSHVKSHEIYTDSR
jgi:ankyrin repeat domain-containing protein 50